MANNNVKIELKKLVDKFDKPYYVGKIEGPFLIDCREPGATFLIFISDEGAEELQIATTTRKSNG